MLGMFWLTKNLGSDLDFLVVNSCPFFQQMLVSSLKIILLKYETSFLPKWQVLSSPSAFSFSSCAWPCVHQMQSVIQVYGPEHVQERWWSKAWKVQQNSFTQTNTQTHTQRERVMRHHLMTASDNHDLGQAWIYAHRKTLCSCAELFKLCPKTDRLMGWRTVIVSTWIFQTFLAYDFGFGSHIFLTLDIRFLMLSWESESGLLVSLYFQEPVWSSKEIM